ncbi:hypothetical protein [Clostridium sp. MCC353]|uniref:hypothetical protein n=1 Tax=Clostridium sp. MCC353 TaxID=2592646 RepID=UPI0031FEDB13
MRKFNIKRQGIFENDFRVNGKIPEKELDSRRPLTEGEAARLNDDFIVEYTYNSNAIDGNGRTGRLLVNLELMKADIRQLISNLQTGLHITTPLMNTM